MAQPASLASRAEAVPFVVCMCAPRSPARISGRDRDSHLSRRARAAPGAERSPMPLRREAGHGGRDVTRSKGLAFGRPLRAWECDWAYLCDGLINGQSTTVHSENQSGVERHTEQDASETTATLGIGPCCGVLGGRLLLGQRSRQDSKLGYAASIGLATTHDTSGHYDLNASARCCRRRPTPTAR